MITLKLPLNAKRGSIVDSTTGYIYAENMPSVLCRNLFLLLNKHPIEHLHKCAMCGAVACWTDLNDGADYCSRCNTGDA